MISAQLPNDEDQRLEALSKYGVLDTLPEDAYDRITRFIAEILDVPIVLVSLVDSDRQWFKSRHGLDASETPRDIAFCSHAILEQDLFVVKDTEQDNRFSKNPLVTGDLGIRFYAGAPLTTPGGHNIGTLCAIDQKPRELTERQQQLLSDCAKIVVDELELTLARQEAEKLNAELEKKVEERTLELAKEVEKHQSAKVALEDAIGSLKATQAELVQSEKLSSLSGMIAGIGHEVNTPVGIGVTAASHLQEKVKEANTRFSSGQLKKTDLVDFLTVAQDSSEILLKNLNRAAALVSSFKKVAVDQVSDEKRSFYLDTYIDEVLLTLRPSLRKLDHKISVKCPKDLKMDSYPGAISQVVTNLILNSTIHAFDEDMIGEMNILITDSDDNVNMIYTDNGKGMEESTLAKIYDPFYTTKRSTGGSGLGMHIVHNLVNQTLNGKIDVASSPGLGIKVQMTIPKR
jgi:C4-dicarboxylate-specific signal transduction histidine kinase